MKPGDKVRVYRPDIFVLKRIRSTHGGDRKEEGHKPPFAGEIVAKLPSGDFIVRVGNNEFAAERHELKKANS